MSKQKVTKTNSFSKLNKIIAAALILVLAGVFAFYQLQKPVQPAKVYYNQNETKMENDYTFEKQGELVFTTSSGDSLAKIDIEFADTNDKRTLGLMFRENMEEKQGMLFIFPFEELQSFWMANTILSLDIIYVNSKREIVKIHKNTTPYLQESYPSNAPAIFVVEVIAGFTDKYNVKEGDKIFWIRKS